MKSGFAQGAGGERRPPIRSTQESPGVSWSRCAGVLRSQMDWSAGAGFSMKKTILVISYFSALIIASGLVMILASAWTKSHVEVWIVRQVAPHAAFSVSLGAGILLYGRLSRAGGWRSLGRIGVAEFTLSAAIGLLLFMASILINRLIGIGLEDNAVYSIMAPEKFWPYFLSILFLVGIVQPLLEEVIFRGEIFPVARNEMGAIFSVVLVSLLFSALHYSFFITSFVFSVAMSLLKLKFNLSSCVVAHCSYNIGSVLIDAF